MPRFRRVPTLALLTLLLSPVQPARSQVVESIEVNVANLDVAVLDRHGKPVQGLTKNDFEVLEDGKPQEITNFTEYTAPIASATAPPAGVEAPRSEAVRPTRPRLIAIMIDLQDIERVRREQFFEGLRTFIATEQRPQDQTAIFVWFKRLEVVVPPTTDKKLVDAALTGFKRTEAWNERALLESIKAEAIAWAEEVAAATGMANVAADEAEFQEMLQGEERCTYMKRKLEAMRQLLASFGSLDVQKVLIVASDDFSAHPDRSCVLLANVKSLAAIANSYGFTIHAFHPPGARTPAQDMSYRFPGTRDPAPNANTDQRAFEESEGLSVLAKDTGGEFAIGAPMAVRALKTAGTSLDNYYSIGYRLLGSRPNEARSVNVRVKNRSWTVHARRTVVAFSDDRRINDAVVSSLYGSARPKTAFAIAANAAGVRRSGKDVVMKISVSVPLERITLLPAENGNVAGHFAIFVAAGREVGDASGVGRKDQRFTRPASAAVAPGERVEYSFDLAARATTKRIAIAVRDEVTHEYGITTIDVKVPGS